MRELSLHIMDIVQNSISAGAGLITVSIEEDTRRQQLQIRITDDGHGMGKDQLAQVQDPFFTTRTTRRVGLGVPLFKMACEMTGGTFAIDSAKGKGTRLEALFHTGHIDMIPIGDMAETMLLLITCNPDLDFLYTRTLDERTFTLDTHSMREILDGVSLAEPEVAAWLREYLAEGEGGLARQ